MHFLLDEATGTASEPCATSDVYITWSLTASGEELPNLFV